MRQLWGSPVRTRHQVGRAAPTPLNWVWLCALVLGLVSLTPAAGPSFAETSYTPQPAVLTTVSTAETGKGDVEVLLNFGPTAPKFSIMRSGSDHPGIAFALSSRGSSARVPANLPHLLRSISFDQQDTVLILNLNTAGAVQMTATAVGDQVISIHLTGGAPQERHDDRPAPTGPLPKAADRDPGEDGFEVVPLKYADVSEVVGLLTEGLSVKSNDSFVPREPAFGSAGMGGSSAFNPVQPTAADQQNESVGQSVDAGIGVDRRLNAIILKGTPEHIARMKEKIAQIDLPVGSVILETVFVELSETGAKNVGLDLRNTSNQIGVATFTSGSSAPTVSGTNQFHGVASASLQAAIYDEVQKGNGRIVSKPRIAAQSGSTAKIITGDALPILTSIALSGVNAVSQQVQYVNVGVTLQIAPRVSSDGFVTSHVFCVVSSVTGYSQGYPTISQREAETSATVQDGETFVIGGLTEENTSTTNTKIPGAADLPLVGDLFKLHQGTLTKTDLYIVVTPHIVRHGDPLPAAILGAK